MALKDIDFRVDAVLPAGGIGQRMGLETPKQASSYLHMSEGLGPGVASYFHFLAVGYLLTVKAK